MLPKIRNAWLFVASGLALIPLFLYINNVVLLSLLVFTYVIAYFFIMRETSLIAQSVMSSEKAKASIPGFMAHSKTLSKFSHIMRQSLRWHLALLLPKLGIVIAANQFLNNGLSYKAPFVSLAPYYYNSYSNLSQGVFVSLSIFKDPEILLITGIALLVFTFCEQALLSALALGSSSFFRLLVMRGMVFVLSMGFMLINKEIFTWEDWARFVSFGCGSAPCDFYCYQTVLRVNETIHTALMSSADAGILQSSNLLRPYDYPWLTMPLQMPQYGWYLLRQIVATGMGVLVYGLWIAAILKWQKKPSPQQNTVIILSPQL